MALIYYIKFSHEIVLKICTEHGKDVAVACTELQKKLQLWYGIL